MNKADYQVYLQGEQWQAIRRRALARAKYKCLVCSSPFHLHVHHKTYSNVGDELPDDLCVLCSDCHRKVHDGRITSVPNPLGVKKSSPRKRKKKKKGKTTKKSRLYVCPKCHTEWLMSPAKKPKCDDCGFSLRRVRVAIKKETK